MSKYYFSRTRSSRKSIQPVIDIDEDEDNKRRDSFGRKRVDVIECLFESSTDEIDDTNLFIQNSTNILWLTFTEISHIRYILAQTTISTHLFNKDKQYSKHFHEHICFRCRKQIPSLRFLPSFLTPKNSSFCYICQQRICKKCLLTNFLPPSSKYFFPVRLQTLINSSSTSREHEINKKYETNPQAKTICYDCSQILSEGIKSSQCPVKSSASGARRSFSSLPLSSNFNLTRISNHKIGKTSIPTTSSITWF